MVELSPKLTRTELKPEVRGYADNLYAQIGGILTPAGIATSVDINQAVTEGRLKDDQLRIVHGLVGKLSQVLKTGEIPLDDERMIKEGNEWERLLGAKVEIPPLPSWVTSEVKSKLEGLRFNELICVPPLNLGNLDDLKKPVIVKRKNNNTGEEEEVDIAVEKYLEKLHAEYPNWKPYESLTDKEKTDHSVVRNLEIWYWQQVRADRIDFPALPGKWLAVEGVEKPNYGTKYAVTPLAGKMGFEDRFNHPWNDITEAQQRVEGDILDEIDVNNIRLKANDKAKLVKLTALQYNLLANRFGWGKTDTYEWVEDEYRGPVISDRLVVGYSGYGGAACVDDLRPDDSYDDDGFRFAVELEP